MGSCSPPSFRRRSPTRGTWSAPKPRRRASCARWPNSETGSDRSSFSFRLPSTLKGWASSKTSLKRLPEGFRYAVEVRHRSWLGSDLPEMLRERGAALTLIDYPRMPRMEEATADFSYIRWLGDRREFPEGHTHLKKERDEDLRWWADLVGRFLEEGKDRLRLRQQPLPEPLALDARPVPGDPARRALMAGPVVFSTGSLYPFGLDRVYGWISEAGYDGVEIMMDDRWDTHQEDYLRDLVERHGLPILALHPPLRRGAGDSIPKRRWCGSRGWQVGWRCPL